MRAPLGHSSGWGFCIPGHTVCPRRYLAPMTTIDYEALAVDLFRRTERAIDTIAALGVDTGITFKVKDIVDRVEAGLPPDYPESANGEQSRRGVIADMARDALSGRAYKQ